MPWKSQADASSYCASVSGQFATTASGSSCTVDESSQAAGDARALGCTSGACPSSAPPLMVAKSTPKLMETCAAGSSCATKTTTGNPMASDDWETPVVK